MENKSIIRLQTSCYKKGNKICLTKEIRLLKTKSIDPYTFDFIDDNIEEIKHIININDVKDGLYILIVCNCSTDYETGYCDDWEYKLIPYNI